jgi:hypothetical protein
MIKLKFIVSLLTLIFVIVACGRNSTNNKTSTSSKSQNHLSLSGSGTKTQRITLNEGSAIVNYAYKGEGNFVVWVKTDEAKELELISNEIGSTSGSKSFHVPSDGSYILDVSSSGNWTVNIQ